MKTADQAEYYAQRAVEFHDPIVASLVDLFDLDGENPRTRLALVDALTRCYQLGRRDGTTEVVAQLQEGGLDVQCTVDIDIATGELGSFSH